MRDEYHEYEDRLLVEEHELYPERFRTMNLKELKTKASAAEFTLIETVEKLVRENVEVETRRKMLDFMVKNPPPSREDRGMFGQTGEAWMRNLEWHMSA